MTKIAHLRVHSSASIKATRSPLHAGVLEFKSNSLLVAAIVAAIAAMVVFSYQSTIHSYCHRRHRYLPLFKSVILCVTEFVL